MLEGTRCTRRVEPTSIGPAELIDIEKIRRDEFPITRSGIYLDHATLGPLPNRHVSAVNELMSLMSTQGLRDLFRLSAEGVDQVRNKAAALLGCDAKHICFVRNTGHGVGLVAQGLEWHAGPLARTVADATAMLAAVWGHDPDDPGSSVRQIAVGPNDLTGEIRGLRIGVPRDFWEPACEPAIRTRFEAALVRLEELGARVTEAPLGLTLLQVMAVGYVITLREAAAYQLPSLRSHREGLGREFGLAMRAGLLVSDRAYRAALRARARITRQVDKLLEDHDVLAMPTVGVLADPLPAGPRPLSRRITENPAPQYTWLANLHGGPAVSVPCGLAPEGLPVGLQLMGRSYDDATVLRAAHAYEQAAGWGQMRSNLWP